MTSCLLLGLLCPPAIRAQSPGDLSPSPGIARQEAQPSDVGLQDTIPLDVLELLMVARLPPNNDPVQLRLGALPESLGAYVPPRARFIAGLEQEGQALAVVRVDGPTETAATWALELERAGVLWRDLPTRGFIGDPSALPMTFCTRDGQLRIDQHSATSEAPDPSSGLVGGRGDLLTITRGHRLRGQRCEAQDDPQARLLGETGNSTATASPVPFPLLRAPTGVAAHGGLTRQGDRQEQRGATLHRTSMTPYELVTFFTEQLEREGWLGVDAVDLGSAAFQTFNFVDEAGAGWFGLLLVSAGDRVTDQRRASFSVERIHG